jgi:hypothetical protein
MDAGALHSGALAEFALAVPLTTGVLYANAKAWWGGGLNQTRQRETLQRALLRTTTVLGLLTLIGAFATLTGEWQCMPCPWGVG